VAADLWPVSDLTLKDPEDPPDESQEDVEAQIASEVSAMKRPRTEPRFGLSVASFLYIDCHCCNSQCSKLSNKYTLRYYSNMYLFSGINLI